MGVPATAAAAPSAGFAPAAVEAPCVGAPRAFFLDIRDGATAADAVDCLVWHDLVRGVTHERFAPGASLTRAQVASLLDRLIGVVDAPLPDPEVAAFADVGGTHGPAIERLAAAGIVAGRSPGRYDPLAPVGRDQLAALLVRTHDHVAGVTRDPSATPPHEFVDAVGSTHEAAIATAAALSLIGGTTPTTYEPSLAATRAQTVMVLARLLQLAVGDASIAADVPGPDGYASRVGPLPASLRSQVERYTWEPGCPVPPTDLRLVELVFTDFDAVDRWGLIVVHRDVASDVASAFGELYETGFPLERVEPIEAFGGDDDASMAVNNTSGFNCRQVTGGTTFSQHSFGRAIDLNPIQNPYVRGSSVAPSAGRAYLDRGDVRPGMVVRPGAVDAFERIGWSWGGDFNTLKDYQHVSASGG